MSEHVPTMEEVNDHWEEYQRVFRLYWDARCIAVKKAVASVSRLKADSQVAHTAYSAARLKLVARELAARKSKADELAAAFVAPLEEVAKGFTTIPWPNLSNIFCYAFRRNK